MPPVANGTVWSKGSCDDWYSKAKSDRRPWSQKWRKWWVRSLPATVGGHLIVYLILYYIIHGVYLYKLDEKQKEKFDKIICYYKDNLSPMTREMTFVLGFFVSNVVKRWWDQYKALPMPDTLVSISHALVDFNNPGGLEFCQTIMRYCMLAYILCIRRFSKSLSERFPDNKSLIDVKVVTARELKLLESNGELGRVWWIPLSWCMTMVKSSKEKKIIAAEQKIVIDVISRFQKKLEDVDTFDYVILPPLYRQTVRFAVWSYFTFSLIGSQAKGEDPYIPFLPVFLIVRFTFFIGWLKVAEALDNPFGQDDDDFQVCQLVSRHLWAIGRNISLYQGPPEQGEEEEDDAGDEVYDNISITINKSD